MKLVLTLFYFFAGMFLLHKAHLFRSLFVLLFQFFTQVIYNDDLDFFSPNIVFTIMLDIFVVLRVYWLYFVLISVVFLAFSDDVSDNLCYALEQLNHKPQNLKQPADKHSEHGH